MKCFFSSRDLAQWCSVLDGFLRLRPVSLVPCHGRPISPETESAAKDLLTCYRDAIQFVQDQTTRLINKGERAATAAAAVVVVAVAIVPAVASVAAAVVADYSAAAAANAHSPSLSYCSGFFLVLLQKIAFSTPSFPHAGLPSSSVGHRLRRLPPSLRTHPFLQEFYGTAEWSARAVYSGRNGWFGGA